MSEQDGAQFSTKQLRSRKTNPANQESAKQAPAAQSPTNDDPEAWKAYWEAHGQVNGQQITLSPEITSLIIAEFNVTREEILKRVELQHQLLSLTLIILGTILTFGVQTKAASVILLYPFLALFLSIAWTSSSTRIREMQLYITTHIEEKVGESLIGWEHFRTTIHRPFGSLTTLSAIAIFIGTELLAAIVAGAVATFSLVEKVQFLLVLFCMITTFLILRPKKIKRVYDLKNPKV